MAINVGDAEITVTADAKPFLPALKRQMAAVRASADKQGKSIGQRLGQSLTKAAEKETGGSGGGGLMAYLLPAAPVITSGLSAVAGAATALAGSLGRASISSAALVGVYGSLGQVMGVAKIATSGLSDALSGQAGAMDKLAPSAQDFVKSLKGLQPRWDMLRKSVQGAVFKGLGDDVSHLGNTLLPVLSKGLTASGHQLNLLLKDVTKFAASKSFVDRFSGALKGNNRIFGTLRKAAVPLLNGLLNLYRALQPAAERLAKKIVSVAKGFSGWTKGVGFAKSVDDYMKKAFHSAHLLWSVVKNLGKALWNVLNSSADAGDGLMKSLSRVTKKFADWTGSIEGQKSIANWAHDGVAAMKTLGHIIGTLAPLFKGMFNPGIFQGFLNIIKSMTPTIITIVKVVQSALAPVLKTIGEAVAKNGPKIAKLFVALSPILKGLGAILGQIVSQALNMVGTVAEVITPIVGAISKFLGPILVKLAPIIAAVVLSVEGLGLKLISLLKYLGPVGRLLASLLGPIMKITSAIFNAAGPAIRFLGKIVGVVFKGIGKVIVPIMKLVGKIISTEFKIAWKIVGPIIRLLGRIIGATFRGISKVIGVVMKFIARVIRDDFNAIKGTITKAMDIAKKVITTVWRVIKSVITGAVRAIGNVVRGGFNAVKDSITKAFNAVKSIVVKVWTTVGTTTRAGVMKVIDFVKSMPDRILALAASFLNAGRDLGSKVISGLWEGLKATGGFVSDIASSIKNAINGALHLPITIHGPGPLPDFTIPAFAKGTDYAPGGAALVGEKGPELVNLPRGSKVSTAEETRALLNGGFPKKMILRIGARDFVAYVESIADDRIDASESLAYQGA